MCNHGVHVINNWALVFNMDSFCLKTKEVGVLSWTYCHKSQGVSVQYGLTLWFEGSVNTSRDTTIHNIPILCECILSQHAVEYKATCPVDVNQLTGRVTDDGGFDLWNVHWSCTNKQV